MDRILIVDCFQGFYNSTYHEEKVHAINEVVHNDPVKSVGVALEAPVHGVAAARTPVLSWGGALRLVWREDLQIQGLKSGENIDVVTGKILEISFRLDPAENK